MNIPLLIAACLTLLAFAAHLFAGTRETAALAPPPDDAARTKHWVQAMCVFQMVSVDLLAITLLLFVAAFRDLGPLEPLLLSGLALLYLAWAGAWLVQLRWLNRPAATIFGLPQWMLFVLCAGLVFLGR
ncbi:hypothetical protein [Sulfitobacter geojensis]|uniref:hypothetical protein n=1 Tax=Sulfitobacter geojensis TaxID=1342299 RepID=UPI003B8C8C59